MPYEVSPVFWYNYNPTEKRRRSIVFNDVITDMGSNQKVSPKVTELFLRGRKFDVSIVFISQSYFKALETITLKMSHIFLS